MLKISKDLETKVFTLTAYQITHHICFPRLSTHNFSVGEEIYVVMLLLGNR